MGTVGMTVTSAQSSMSDSSAAMAPAECLAVEGAAEAPVHGDSGFRADRDQAFNNGNDFTHHVKQAVVVFPTVEKARSFLDASAQRWPACKEYTHTQSGSQWSVGQINVAADTLKTITTQRDTRAPGRACGRPLAPAVADGRGADQAGIWCRNNFAHRCPRYRNNVRMQLHRDELTRVTCRVG